MSNKQREQINRLRIQHWLRTHPPRGRKPVPAPTPSLQQQLTLF